MSCWSWGSLPAERWLARWLSHVADHATRHRHLVCTHQRLLSPRCQPLALQCSSRPSQPCASSCSGSYRRSCRCTGPGSVWPPARPRLVQETVVGLVPSTTGLLTLGMLRGRRACCQSSRVWHQLFKMRRLDKRLPGRGQQTFRTLHRSRTLNPSGWIQLGAQVYSDASSIRKYWMQRQQWKKYKKHWKRYWHGS